ncbi:MAG TPA: fluoride efflux transporter CrcB [Phycisphaerales bacterium]|nr:fluoride efflux transporter CrcB [Phycisphaerales bacterium]
MTLTKILFVFLGGGIGSALRYLLAGVAQSLSLKISPHSLFPIGTMTVNVLGCLAIGALGAAFAEPHLAKSGLRLFLVIGILGGFTTFSSFSLESFQLANDGALRAAAINVLLTNVLCLSSAFFAYRITEHFVRA